MAEDEARWGCPVTLTVYTMHDPSNDPAICFQTTHTFMKFQQKLHSITQYCIFHLKKSGALL